MSGPGEPLVFQSLAVEVSKRAAAAATAPLLAKVAELEAAYTAELDKVSKRNYELRMELLSAQAQAQENHERAERLEAELAASYKMMENHKDTWFAWEEKRKGLKQDAERLDWLDNLNAALNKQNGTTYGWKLILSPMIVRLMAGHQGRGFVGDVDLNDANAKGASSCRAAIDAMRTGEHP